MVTGRDAAGDRLPEVIGALHVGRRERSRAERRQRFAAIRNRGPSRILLPADLAAI
jgi:hypothetical protein